MSNPFRFAIVGTGSIAGTYVQAVNNLDNAEIVGVVSRSGKSIEGLPEEIEIQSDLSEIRNDYDGVILATPNGMHHVGALAAAKLGKHVLTEKPLDITVEAMDEMINVCKQAGVKLGVTYQRRVRPDNITIKNLIDGKQLGRIFAVELSVKCYRDQAYYDSAPYRGNKAIDGGGPFIQQAAHNIDIYTWFFGLPDKVFSMLDTFTHEMEGEDYGVAMMRHRDGMIGTIIAATSTYPGFNPKLSIHSEKGTVILENDVITEWHVRDMDNPSKAVLDKNSHSGASSAKVADTSGHEAVITDFVQAVREDREPRISGENARGATELILAIYNANQATNR